MRKLIILIFILFVQPSFALAQFILDKSIPTEFHGVWSTNCTNDIFEANTYIIFDYGFLYLSESDYPYNQFDIVKVGNFDDYIITQDGMYDENYYFYKIENNTLIEKSSPQNWNYISNDFLKNDGSIYNKCEEVRYLTNENFKTIIDFASSEVPQSCSGDDINSTKCIKNIFDYIDLTNDGRLSSAELTRALKTLSLYAYFLLNEEELGEDFIAAPNILAAAIAPMVSEIILQNYDFDDSGNLRLNEFQHDLIKPDILKSLKTGQNQFYSIQEIFNLFQSTY